LAAIDEAMGYKCSKTLKSKDQMIFRDEETISAALGMIRFGIGLKSKEQLIIEELYNLYDDQVHLENKEKPSE
jgi:hypothetical protein